MNKLHVALTLLKLLSEYRHIDSVLVAEKMEVSRRTAQRYLEELAAMPFIEHDEANHQYRLAADHKLEANYVYDNQIAFISAMLDYAGQVFGDDAFVKSISERFSRNIAGTKPLILQDVPEDLDKDLYEKIVSHINMGDAITFHYSKYDKTYEVVPVQIIYADGFFYLAAVRVDDTSVIKKFALDFISKIVASGKASDVDLSHLELSLSGSIWSDSYQTKVLVRITSDAAHYFKRRQIFPYQEIIQENDDSILMQCVVSKDSEFIVKALPWADSLTILEPAEYKEEYLRVLRKGIELNT